MEITLKKRTLFNTLIIALVIAVTIPILVFASTIVSSQTSLVMGKSEMYVQDLQEMRYFYVDLVGLEILNETADSLELGFGEEQIITLIQKDGLRFENTYEAGLYHNAILFPTRSSLANAVNTVLTASPGNYQGSADHLVSEAFYFGDPEGNGVELYFDKPRSDWEYTEEGTPKMGSIYINERTYIQTYAANTPVVEDVKMGHVHLKVGDIALAKSFYVDTLDFDQISISDQTLFISRDGYHHHIGMNTWQSKGAAIRDEDVYGLYSFEFEVSNAYFNQLKSSIKNAGHVIEQETDVSFMTKDPWGNRIRVKLA